MVAKLSVEDVVARKVGEKSRLRHEKNVELLQAVRDNAVAAECADKALRKSIAEAYHWGVPMTHIARAWGKTEGAVRMYIKRRTSIR